MNMKTTESKFETMMVAAAFAEEGEFDTARSILNEKRATDRPSQYDYQRPEARKDMRAD
jgi:hypothetical protein